MTSSVTTASGLSIADAAEQTGLSVDTLRYYERDGLMLAPVPRTSSGHRAYGPDELQWITLVTCLRATGMPIRGVRRYAELVRAGAGTEAERLALLQAHREEVLVRLAETQDHLGAIDRKIGIYTDAVTSAA